MRGNSGEWVPLLEYAVRKSVSLSTLRRYIKTNKIIYKLVRGRYLVFDNGTHPRIEAALGGESVTIAPIGVNALGLVEDAQAERLEKELRMAHREIAELKTLIALYEEKIPQTSSR